MSDSAVGGLARLAGQTFQSFSEAAASVLGLLEEQLPAGRLVLGELNWNEGEYRIMQARGNSVPGFEPGLTLPLPQSLCLHMVEDTAPRLTGRAASDPVYGKLQLRSDLSIHSYVGAPLEVSDGTRVASICAVSSEPDRFTREDLELLTISGRILAYEWERVRRELELRRLVGQARDPAISDSLTGVVNRHTFMDALDREWHITERGIAECYVVAVRFDSIAGARERYGNAMGDLLLKDAAAALTATARRTDIVGRVSEDGFGAILVGCKGLEGAAAFCARFESALARVSSERPEPPRPSMGVCALSGVKSGAEAFERAEQNILEPAGKPSG